MTLKRSIGAVGLLFTSVGAMVGSGWLFGPLYAVHLAGPAATVAWVVGGLAMFIVALTFAELATMFPVMGGVARFSQFSHGTLTSFIMSWMAWLSCVTTAPPEVQAILQYASVHVDGLIHEVNHVPVLTHFGLAIAAVLLIIMSWVNIMGVRFLTRSNTLIVWWKLLVPIVVAAVLFHTAFHIENFTQYGGVAPYGWRGILEALPMAGVIFSFIGFRQAIAFAGEAKDPQRSVPRAILLSLLICTLLYVVIEIVFIGVQDPQNFAEGWHGLSFDGDAGPFAGIAGILGLTWLAVVIYLDAVVSPFGVALVYTATTARLTYAMSKNGYAPPILMHLNKRGVPGISVIFNGLVGMFFFMPFPSWQELIGFMVSAVVVAYGMGPVSVLSLRLQMPEAQRPFRLPFALPLCALAFYICNLIAFWTGWSTIWRLLLSIVLGMLLLLFHRRTEKDSMFAMAWREAMWLFPYFIGLGILSYCGSFGGGLNIMPFGWDFLVIGIFSLLILWLAVIFRLPAGEAQKQLTGVVMGEEVNDGL